MESVQISPGEPPEKSILYSLHSEKAHLEKAHRACCRPGCETTWVSSPRGRRCFRHRKKSIDSISKVLRVDSVLGLWWMVEFSAIHPADGLFTARRVAPGVLPPSLLGSTCTCRRPDLGRPSHSIDSTGLQTCPLLPFSPEKRRNLGRFPRDTGSWSAC